MSLGVLFNTDRLGAAALIAYAKRLDEMGFESLWLPELFTRDPLATSGYLLAATEQIKLATGIANVYTRDPVAMVSSASALAELSDERFILGLGVSNVALNQARGHAWQNPVSKLREYVTAMNAVKLSCPRADYPVYVAAHGPKMLAAAAELADGANTYLMPVQHAAQARATLGDAAVLNTMLFCLNDENPETARATARKAIAYYVGLDYYHRAWRGFGFDDADFADGGSDALVDAVVAWGNTDTIRGRIQGQYDAGASRVIVIPVGAGMAGQPDWGLLEALI